MANYRQLVVSQQLGIILGLQLLTGTYFLVRLTSFLSIILVDMLIWEEDVG